MNPNLNLIDILQIIAATLGVYWFIGTFIFLLTDENPKFSAWWTCGLVAAFLYIFFTPMRIINNSRWRKGIKK